ncbi:hypothetical protein FEN17_06405 [Dyadobacter luticola]|uniref:Uncharacterized protein n=1 Tax=Dyadobacter luticola TaxID=1979387 RepID=A0A5R9L4G6_9BACT|nr:hypothetical protein FEN17_06405 [Dyadobacter luticola]
MRQAQNSGTMHQMQSSRAKAENKDNLDSRHREEEMVKGNHLTNNEKDHHSLGKNQRQHQ